jgi:hypothetical protein
MRTTINDDLSETVKFSLCVDCGHDRLSYLLIGSDRDNSRFVKVRPSLRCYSIGGSSGHCQQGVIPPNDSNMSIGRLANDVPHTTCRIALLMKAAHTPHRRESPQLFSP